MNLDDLRTLLDRRLGDLLALLMGAMVLDVLWGVASRFLLQNPSSVSEEIARYLLIWVGLLGAACAAGRRMHLAIDLLPSALQGRSRLALLLFLELLVFTVAGVVLAWGGSGLMSLTFELGQRSALGIPLGAVYLALPLAGLILMLYSGLEIIRVARRLSTNDAPEENPTTAEP